MSARLFFCFSIWILTLTPTVSAQDAPIVIHDVRIVDGTGSAAKIADVVIIGERIQAVTSDSERWRAASDATVIEGGNRTLLPGLIDLHIHLAAGGRCPQDEQAMASYYEKEVPGMLQQYLAAGVTAIQSVGDPVGFSVATREKIKRGELAGPHLFVAGPVVTAVGGHPAVTIFRNNPFGRSTIAAEVSSEQDARQKIQELKRNGVDLIKFVYQGDGVRTQKLAPEAARAIIDEAHRLELRVGVHSGSIEDTEFLLRSGVDTLLHGIGQPIRNEDIIEHLVKAKTYYVATLSVGTRRRGPPSPGQGRNSNLGLLAKHPVRIAVGTDTFPPGFPPGKNTHREAALMVDTGMTPMAVLVAATRTSADQLGMLSEFGTVEAGKIADLLIVDGNPDEDIDALTKVSMVIRGGKVVPRKYVPRK